MLINDPNIIKAAMANNRLSGLTLNKEVKAAIDEALAKENITTTELINRFLASCELKH